MQDAPALSPTSPRTRGPRALATLVLGALLMSPLACGRDEKRGGPPPPPATSPLPPSAAASKPAACAAGGGTLTDVASAPFLPRVSGGFCLDPNGGDKAFGEAAPLPIDKICDLFDGECEIYKSFNIRRVLEARYVDGAGSPATIDVHLSKFGTTESAYAMFTKRVVGDGDPADPATPRPVEGGGAASLGLGNAYLWRGLYLAEITYNDETAAEAGIKSASDRLLPPLVKDIGSKLPGEVSMPPPVAALPKPGLLPLGVRYVTKDILGIDGIGSGAFGYYKDGDKRYRIASVVRGDADQGKDVIRTLAKRPGAAKEKGIGDEAVRVILRESGEGSGAEGAPIEWIFARSGKLLLGIGDEARVLRSGMTADEVSKISLAKAEKIERLKKALSP